MLNKVIVIFTILSLTTSYHKISDAQKKNIKTISKNNRNMNTAKVNISRHIRNINNQFKNISRFHSNITKNGVNLNTRQYNRLLSKYGRMLKKYNKTRSSVCAKLPPLWALTDKKKDDYTQKQVQCKIWYYKGQLAGDNLAEANYMLGYQRHYSSRFINRFSAIRTTLCHKRASSLVNHFRRCYLNGFNRQLRYSMIGRIKNKPLMLKFKLPFKTNSQKTKKIANAIKRIKKASK